MPRKKSLKWGETPLHRMSKKKLLHHALMMYASLSRCRSRLATEKAMYGSSSYWGKDGMGGIALEMAEQSLSAVEKGYEDANPTHLFRYATDLLFDSSQYRIGSSLVVCPICGIMWGSLASDNGTVCGSKLNTECKGVLRPITWDDLAVPKKERSAA